MSTSFRSRLGDMSSLARLVDTASVSDGEATEHKRRMVAELCRLVFTAHGAQRSAPDASLSPRMRQTLERLLSGDSEKQIASHLRVSPHTVHVYVKRLYRRFNVCSRGELLAHFVRR